MEKEIIAGALFLLAFISPTPASPPASPSLGGSLGGPAPQLQAKKPNMVIIQPPLTTTAANTQVEAKTVPTITREPLNDTQINFLGNCESGMSADRSSGNGYYGAFQFSYGTWRSMNTAYERADLAPLDVQIEAVQKLLSRSSILTQFPGCAVKMRATGLL